MNADDFNIFLVGLMGSGKTTLGKALAKSLNKKFFDSDQELEEKMGVDVSTMFEIEGEKRFRLRESDLLEELVLKKNIVLATGGGAVISECNRKLLKKNGIVVYLRASIEDIFKRIEFDKNRPLLQRPNRLEILKELARKRGQFYIQCCHLQVETGNQPIPQIISCIRDYCKNYFLAN